MVYYHATTQHFTVYSLDLCALTKSNINFSKLIRNIFFIKQSYIVINDETETINFQEIIESV